MWIFLSGAFFSIVEIKGNPRSLNVRARFKPDINRVFPGIKVTRTPKADYLYRAAVPRQMVADRIAQAVLNIDYPNFKDTVTEKKRSDAYLRVWTAMYTAQEKAPRDLFVEPEPLHARRQVCYHLPDRNVRVEWTVTRAWYTATVARLLIHITKHPRGSAPRYSLCVSGEFVGHYRKLREAMDLGVERALGITARLVRSRTARLVAEIEPLTYQESVALRMEEH